MTEPRGVRQLQMGVPDTSLRYPDSMTEDQYDEQLWLAELNKFARTLDPSAKVLIKDDSLFMKLLFVFVGVFNKRFMTDFATTICNRVYIPRSWRGRDLRRLLVHEVGGHVRQCRACGLGIHPWVGFPIYMILYLLVFFPLGLAYPRYKFELGADACAWRWGLDNGESPQSIIDRSLRFAGTVGSWDYLRPWPRSWVLAGFKRRADKEIAKPRKIVTIDDIMRAELIARGAPSCVAVGLTATTLDECDIKKEAFEAWWGVRERQMQGAKGREPEVVIARQAWDAGWAAKSK